MHAVTCIQSLKEPKSKKQMEECSLTEGRGVETKENLLLKALKT